MRKKVAVGLSGGVDSSLSAALLVEQGYEVTGVFLECWRAPGCRVDEDRKDALDIALQLGIPYRVLDFKQAYRDRVVEYFYREYAAGRTPNPDTMCNREIKFGLFYDWAMDNGFDYVATGHYARIADSRWQIANSNGKPLAISNMPYAMQRGFDNKKDQTYFLYLLRQEQLAHVLFPIGHMTKSQVRAEAQKRGLLTAKKPDSQGICFIGEVNVTNFLKERINENPGKIIIKIEANSEWLIANSKYEPLAISNIPSASMIIGNHIGVPFYTIGQKVGKEINQALVAKLCKRGLLPFDPTNMPPLFVISKNTDTNTIVVGVEELTYADNFQVTDIHWLIPRNNDQEITSNVYVRIRHGGELIAAHLSKQGSDPCIKVELDKPAKGVAPGQACVFYSSDATDSIVLGGGIIELD